MADYEEFRTSCPRCKAPAETADLRVVGGHFSTFAPLSGDGFSLAEGQLDTEDEMVMCQACKEVFPLDECMDFDDAPVESAPDNLLQFDGYALIMTNAPNGVIAPECVPLLSRERPELSVFRCLAPRVYLVRTPLFRLFYQQDDGVKVAVHEFPPTGLAKFPSDEELVALYGPGFWTFVCQDGLVTPDREPRMIYVANDHSKWGSGEE